MADDSREQEEDEDNNNTCVSFHELEPRIIRELEDLGSGNFGFVDLVEIETPDGFTGQVARKIQLFRRSSQQAGFWSEVDALRKGSNLKVYAAHLNESGNVGTVYLEYLPSDRASRGLMQPEWSVGLALMLQLLLSLRRAHSRGLVHRDIKRDNVKITRDAEGRQRYWLIDWGLACAWEPFGRVKPCTQDNIGAGTPSHLSPWALKFGTSKEPPSSIINSFVECASDNPDEEWMVRLLTRNDLWSAALVVFELMVGNLKLFDRHTGSWFQRTPVYPSQREIVSTLEDKLNLIKRTQDNETNEKSLLIHLLAQALDSKNPCVTIDDLLREVSETQDAQVLQIWLRERALFELSLPCYC